MQRKTMNYWESKFRGGGSIWGNEPSDSAIAALEIFSRNKLKELLIPGIGYGRNAGIFIDKGFEVTGIEISESAIEVARSNGINCIIHHGSVTSMPFDSKVYDAVFCYALVHVLNSSERKNFMRSCFNQLKKNGIMIFTATSKEMDLFGRGKPISKDRFEIESGLNVFFYDPESIVKEFTPFGLIDYKVIDEPVKFMKGVDPMKLYFVVCKK
jgi:SAM-dependent methyltransferase